MSEEKKSDFGMTFWDAFYRFRVYVFILVLLVALVLFSQVYTFTENDVIGVVTFVFFTLVSYWLSRVFGGFLMDLTELESGYIGMRELDLWEFETMAQKFITYASDMGPIVVVAPYVQTNEKLHSLLEVAFNTRLAKEIAEFQKDWFAEYLRLSRVKDFETTKELKKEWQKLKKTLGLGGCEKNESE